MQYLTEKNIIFIEVRVGEFGRLWQEFDVSQL